MTRIATAVLLLSVSTVVGDFSDGLFPNHVVARFEPEPPSATERPAYFDDVARVRADMHEGRFRRALFALDRLEAAPAGDVKRLRAICLARLGQTETALSLLDQTDVETVRGRATILCDAGRPADAIALLEPVVVDAPTDWISREQLSSALEQAGDLDRAASVAEPFFAGDDSPYARFARDGAIAFEFADELTAIARGVDRWARLTAAYPAHDRLHDGVLEMFVASYDLVDREYWPARVAAAEYLLRHGNRRQAAEEIEAASAFNRVDVRLNRVRFQITMLARKRDEARKAIRTLRGVDPNSPDALMFDAQLRLLDRDGAGAIAILESLATRRPTCIETLSHLAAAYSVRDRDADAARVIAQVEAFDPDNAVVHASIAHAFASVYYDHAGAIPHLRRAIERAPWWAQLQHDLGAALLYDGNEDAGRAALEQAAAVDPFNLETTNYLRVLEELSNFKTFESKHFVFRFSDRDDPAVPMVVAPGMDDMYERMTTLFDYVPDRKPIVEVFPDAQGFSVRTAGVPGLESFGASLGRVMTVVAPRGGQTLGPFNWARVLRHEFVHTLNLLYTRGRVPRWLTEGLATWQEDVPFRFAWVPPMLYEKAMAGEIYTPQEAQLVLNGGAGNGEMAYMAGAWVARWMFETHGQHAILKLLDGYRQGMSDDEAFILAIGQSVDDWRPAFVEWGKRQVEGWGYDAETKKKFDALQKEADEFTRADQLDKAAGVWEQCAALQPMNPLPPRRLAGIYLRQNDYERALPRLKQMLPLELQDNRFAKRIATIYEKAEKLDVAIEYARKAIEIDPYDAAAHDQLGRLFAKTGNEVDAAMQADLAKRLGDRAVDERERR
jgi:tetratricopeptide (TPR) repeat protein